MNWPVLKDKKWLAIQSTSILLAVTGVILAIGSNSYWALFIFLSMILMSFGVSRATKLTR